ncbi:MAG: TIGR00282 family metallophosphoesterase [Acidobacteria bacterium]|nr:TIGR00282 family metallophosphoesterase [Acidobacteriota bacterium]
MRILFIGDIYGSAGRRIVADHVGDIVRTQQIDLVIANCENAAAGFGITPRLAEELLGVGIHVLTSGNHIWDKKEILEYIGRQPRLLRPDNYPGGSPGSGVFVGSTTAGVEYAVINLQGRTHLPNTDCPFRRADAILASLAASVRVRVVDFHAEVTSEKIAFGWYVDGRVSAVLGTHTHVPTADERILPGGTAYHTDVGMTGSYDSVIGAEKEAAIGRFLTGMPVRLEPARTDVRLAAAILDLDETTGRATAIRRHMINGD